jgi:hypothetical protein
MAFAEIIIRRNIEVIMKRIIILIIVVIVLFLALTPDGVCAAADGLEDYMAMHRARIGKALERVENTASNNCDISCNISLFDDTRINDDSEPGRFAHQYSACVPLSGNRILTGWEDGRNGDLDIFGQKISSGGTTEGSNQLLIADDNYLSQKMLKFARSSEGTIAAVWVDELGDLRLCFYDSSFVQLSEVILVNDNITANVVSYPDLVFLSDNRLAVVWEDTRLGSAIYAQLFNTSFGRVGTNFEASPDESGKLFWSPAVARGDNGLFAIAWEEIGSSSGNIYLLLFDAGGAPIGIPINAADLSSQDEDQFGPDLVRLEAKGYMLGWSDSRGADQNIYGQIFDQNGNKVDTNIVISEGSSNIASELAFAASTGGEVLAVWSNIAARAQINAQAFDDAGEKIGANILVSNALASGQRFSPAAAYYANNAAAVSFSDTREGIPHIYAQNLNPDYSLSGANYRLSSAGFGAQQGGADITRMANGDVALVWRDERYDEGDIYFQRCTETGVKVGSNQQINDDGSIAFQDEPAIGSGENGSAIVAWVDGRTEGDLTGVNIFAQFITSSGLKDAGNFRVNDDPAGAMNTQSQPDCDMARSGRAAVVWTDNRNLKSDIYCQLYDQLGHPEGGNFKVNKGDYDCYNPAVSMLDNELFVVAWNVIIESKSYIQFQIFNADGTFSGDNMIIPEIDTALNQQFDFDLSTNPYFGIFVLAWINQSDTESEIHSMIIDFSGMALSSVKIVSDVANLGFEDISVDMDAINSYGVAWSDRRDGIKRSYLGFVDQATVVLPNQLISRNPMDAREQEPAVAVSGRQAVCVWSDNRNRGSGYDIYVNSETYNPTPAEDNNDLPLPASFALSQNYPNPFNPRTRIDFSISGNLARATFEVVNILGQTVYEEELLNLSAGAHTIEFNADDLPSGVYLYRLMAGNESVSRKMTLLK